MNIEKRFLLPFVLVLVGLFAGTAVLMNQPSMNANTPRQLENHQGPWPECLGLAGDDCVQLIESAAEDVRGRVYIVPPDSMVTMDFREDRVRVYVNDKNIVEKAPQRG